jgi:hypothetical protein
MPRLKHGMFGPLLVAVAICCSLPCFGELSFEARVDAVRAIERVRYGFAIDATQPFDEVYPRKTFEDRVRYEMDEERILKDRYGIVVSQDDAAKECRRIDLGTLDEDQWKAIQMALGNRRPLVEEVFCRPLMVQRVLRAKFAFDRQIHAAAHQAAREARARFRDGKKVSGSRSMILSRTAGATSNREMLESARKGTPRDVGARQIVQVRPEVARVLEKDLHKPGDVTTILEDLDRFEVYRLRSITPAHWNVERVVIPKRDYYQWFEKERVRGAPGPAAPR